MKYPERQYNMTDDQLKLRVGDLAVAMERDEAEFITRGVTALMRQEFETEGNTFELFPPDSTFQADVTLYAQQKNQHRAQTTIYLQKISGFVQQEWGLGSPQYKKLGIKNLQPMRDMQFITAARVAAEHIEGWLPTLSAIGLTQADIDNVRTEAQLMEDDIHAIGETEMIRDEKTLERRELGNALYQKLAKYCEIGKLIWENVNIAKYNDYIIYKTVTHGLPKVQNLSVVMGGPTGNDATLNWDMVPEATTYEVYASTVPNGAPAADFSRVDTVDETTYLGFVMNGQQTYYKVRARNATMLGYFSDVQLGVGPL